MPIPRKDRKRAERGRSRMKAMRLPPFEFARLRRTLAIGVGVKLVVQYIYYSTWNCWVPVKTVQVSLYLLLWRVAVNVPVLEYT